MELTKYKIVEDIWNLLTHAAEHEKLFYTYKGLARKLGMRDGSARAMNNYLGPIMFYCQHRRLPPLTILVVNQETGEPGEGFTAVKQESYPNSRNKVFRRKWSKISMPSVDDLLRAKKEVKGSNKLRK